MIRYIQQIRMFPLYLHLGNPHATYQGKGRKQRKASNGHHTGEGEEATLFAYIYRRKGRVTPYLLRRPICPMYRVGAQYATYETV